MQQDGNCGDEEATVDVQFTDLPNALIACKVPEDLFSEGSLKVRRICRASRPIYSINVSIVHSDVYFWYRLMFLNTGQPQTTSVSML